MFLSEEFWLGFAVGAAAVLTTVIVLTFVGVI
jgi:hypothetical protein